MICQNCQSQATRVIDSRTTDGGHAIRRRRECEACKFRFTTFERAQTTSLMVEKNDGTTEPYQREKLERSIMIACAKRPINIHKIRESLTETEETKWAKQKTIKAEQLGEDVMEILRGIDPVAYIRFASVYKKFSTPKGFETEIREAFKNFKG